MGGLGKAWVTGVIVWVFGFIAFMIWAGLAYPDATTDQPMPLPFTLVFVDFAVLLVWAAVGAIVAIWRS